MSDSLGHLSVDSCCPTMTLSGLNATSCTLLIQMFLLRSSCMATLFPVGLSCILTCLDEKIQLPNPSNVLCCAYEALHV